MFELKYLSNKMLKVNIIKINTVHKGTGGQEQNQVLFVRIRQKDGRKDPEYLQLQITTMLKVVYESF